MESDKPIVNGDGPLEGPMTPEDRNSRLDTLSVRPMLIGLSWLRGPLFYIIIVNNYSNLFKSNQRIIYYLRIMI